MERARRFPASVEAELARRHHRRTARARGRVRDLDRPEARAEVARASVERHLVPAYDTAVSVGQLVRFPDLVAAMRGIDRLLVPDGELLLVEPDASPGLVSLFVDSFWALTPRLAGFHVGRDVTAAVRATTLVLDDVERFAVRTLVSPLRNLVGLRAARVVQPEPTEPRPVEVVT